MQLAGSKTRQTPAVQVAGVTQLRLVLVAVPQAAVSMAAARHLRAGAVPLQVPVAAHSEIVPLAVPHAISLSTT